MDKIFLVVVAFLISGVPSVVKAGDMPKIAILKWDDAEKYCSDHNLHLPTSKELEAMVDNGTFPLDKRRPVPKTTAYWTNEEIIHPQYGSLEKYVTVNGSKFNSTAGKIYKMRTLCVK